MESATSGLQVGYDFRAERAHMEKLAAQKMDMAFTAPPQQVKEKTLIDIEFDLLKEVISELDASVSELIASIGPVLQPIGEVAQDKSMGKTGETTEAMPSEVRSKLVGLRRAVQNISSKIAPIRFRIEI